MTKCSTGFSLSKDNTSSLGAETVRLSMKAFLPLLASAVIGFSSHAESASIDLPVYGFQIDGLEASVGSEPSTALMTFLPVSDGFAPNINVQIQPYAGPMKDYIAMSKAQFAPLNWKLVSDKAVGDKEWAAEYTGPLQGQDLHFYARAIARDGKVYLVTGTAKESQWATLGETLRKHVDSFKLK